METLLGFQDEIVNSPLFALMQGPFVLLSIVTVVAGCALMGMGLYIRHKNKKKEVQP
jgi:hypothetical protein